MALTIITKVIIIIIIIFYFCSNPFKKFTLTGEMVFNTFLDYEYIMAILVKIDL